MLSISAAFRGDFFPSSAESNPAVRVVPLPLLLLLLMLTLVGEGPVTSNALLWLRMPLLLGLYGLAGVDANDVNRNAPAPMAAMVRLEIAWQPRHRYWLPHCCCCCCC